MLSCVVHLLDPAPQSNLRREKQGLDGKDIARDGVRAADESRMQGL